MSSACAVFHACLWLMCQQTLVRLIVGCVCACVRVCVWGGDRVAQCFADSSLKAILRRATLQSG